MKCNKALAVLLIIAVVLAFLLLFPPWKGVDTLVKTEEHPEGLPSGEYEFIGFHFIGSNAQTLGVLTRNLRVRVDWVLLALLSGPIVAIMCVLLVLVLWWPHKVSEQTR